MRRLTEFPGFEIQTTSHLGHGSESTAGGGFNPFAHDTGRVGVIRQPKLEPLFADLPATGGKDLSTTLFSVEPKQETPVILHPVAQTSAPMIQPRAKDGQRLLYKHPHCPRVGPKGSYSLLVGESDQSATAWLMQFDGGANPNPGPASAGAVLWTPPDLDGKRSVAFEAGKFLGKATNNIGEAQGLLLGLQIASVRGARELLIEGDSELIVFQQTGQYKVSNANLKRWWAEIQAAMMDETCFDWIAIRQVPREFNERADSITKEVLQKKAGFTRA